MDIEDSMRGYMNDAAVNGLEFAKNIVMDKTKNIENPDVKNEIVAMAVKYVVARVPDALEYFGLDDDAKIHEFITARLPQLEKS